MICSDWIVTRIDGGLDLLHHFLCRDDVLAGEVSAFLGKYLVLDLDARRARALQRANRAHDVHRVAVAGIGIDDDRKGYRIRNRRHRLADFSHGRQPDVGHAEQHIGDAGAGDVHGLKTEIFNDAREQGVGRAGNRDGRATRQQFLELSRTGH